MQTEMVPDTEHHRGSATGNWVVLIAVVAFVVGTFLPLMRPQDAPGFINRLYRTVTNTGGLVEGIGSFLSIYAGALTAGTVAVIGIRLPDRRRVAPALAAAVAAWSLSWIGVLLNYRAFADRWTFLVGYWWVLASLVFAMVGAIIALRSSVRSAVPWATETELVSQ